MNKSFFLKSVGCAAFLAIGVASASAPSGMVVVNNTLETANAYMHNIASPYPTAPKSSESIPWGVLKSMCDGKKSMLKGSDSCAFDVYATYTSNPKLIHVATVTFFLSNGNIIDIVNAHGLQYGLKIVSTAPGQFELDNV